MQKANESKCQKVVDQDTSVAKYVTKRAELQDITISALNIFQSITIIIISDAKCAKSQSRYDRSKIFDKKSGFKILQSQTLSLAKKSPEENTFFVEFV